jgi:subtilisin-like proprotein convertase family protein
VAIIDGSIEIAHPDLVDRFIAGASYSYRTSSADPSPPSAAASAPDNFEPGQADDAHGTAVAGIVGATANNLKGGRGVAPGVSLMGFDPLIKKNDSLVGDALNRAINAGADVVNNSWSTLAPSEGGNRSLYRASSDWTSALERATREGRQGKGAVVVLAAGNGGRDSGTEVFNGENADQANYSGYANDPRVIAVGAVDGFGREIQFSEPGANVLVAGFSGADLGVRLSTAGIFTTDLSGSRGYDVSSDPNQDYTRFFDGTSAATPMVSGVVALMLQAKPSLTWRDVRWILASTARAATGRSSPGSTTAVSALNSHGYIQTVGFGIVDAAAAVAAAKTFQPLGSEVTCDTGRQTPNGSTGLALADNDRTGLTRGLSIAAAGCTIRRIESVQLELAVSHGRSGDLRATLVAPSGNGVQLMAPHTCSASGCTSMADGFSFGAVRFMGEAPQGEWTLKLSDERTDQAGALLWWRVVVKGHM